MANHKSAIKRARQNEIRRQRNRGVKTRVKSVIKEVSAAALGEDQEATTAKLKSAQSLIDKAAKKGVLHRRTAARKISRLTKAARRAPA
ncbi:MAG: 30S ribosomal protein S20 [Desulfobacterales bacterium]|nr:30S ribosomal protein S20 [Desulfobacterales bacterium]